MKKVFSVMMIIVLLISFTGCQQIGVEKEGERENKEVITSMFVEVETAPLWKVVYHKETKVMYVVSDEMYNHGTFTLLVDSDGSPLLWKGGAE